jgi:hypothetical protein
MGDEFHTSLIISSPPMVCATALLNANAFPQAAQLEAAWAARRFALFLHNTAALTGEIDKAAAAFLAHLKRNWSPYVSAVRRRPELDCIAYSDGLQYLSCMHSGLYEFKAFLDLYTRLLGKLIAPDGSPPNFSRGKVDRVELSGGRVVNWISNLSTKTLPQKTALSDRIATASRDWITPAVTFRDTLGHFRDLPGLRHMSVSLTHGPTSIALSDISRPEMPNGRGLDEYASTLCTRLGEFVAATIRLAPLVNETLLEPWDRAARYLVE